MLSTSSQLVRPSGDSPSNPHTLTSVPILLLNVHENCNCRCLMCDIWQRPPGAELDPASLIRHRKSIRALGVQQIVLTGGEPLLHSNFEALCSFVKSCDVQLTLLTTGLLLAKRAEGIAQWVDEIIVSLDGPEEVHDRIRRVRGAFELIRTGIEVVRRHRQSMPIHARSTVQRANFLFLRQTVAAAKSLGFDSISFLATDVSSHAFNRDLVWPGERQNEIALASDEVASLELAMDRLLEECSDDIAAHFIIESTAKLRRIVRRFREHLGELPPKSPVCNAPWTSAVLEVDGSVRPCFFHPKIGAIGAGSLEDVINSPEALRFRSTLDIDANTTCRRCVCSLNYQPSSTDPLVQRHATEHSAR